MGPGIRLWVKTNITYPMTKKSISQFPKWSGFTGIMVALHWHNERDGVSNHRRLDCTLNRLFRHRLKKILKLRLTDPCENSPVTGEYPTQRDSNTEMYPFDNVIMIWCNVKSYCSSISTNDCIYYLHIDGFQYSMKEIDRKLLDPHLVDGRAFIIDVMC